MAEFEPDKYIILEEVKPLDFDDNEILKIVVDLSQLDESDLHPVNKPIKIEKTKVKTRADREPVWIVKRLHPDEPGEMVIRTKIFRGGTKG